MQGDRSRGFGTVLEKGKVQRAAIEGRAPVDAMLLADGSLDEVLLVGAHAQPCVGHDSGGDASQSSNGSIDRSTNQFRIWENAVL